MRHQPVLKVAISNIKAAPALLTLFEAPVPHEECLMHDFHLALNFHLLAHLAHQPAALPV